MNSLSTTQQEQDLKFDEMFDIWKATDHGSKLENFPENHLNLALKVKEFMHSRDLAIENAKVEEILAKVKGKHITAKKSYPSDSWDSGFHDALFAIESLLVALLTTSPSR